MRPPTQTGSSSANSPAVRSIAEAAARTASRSNEADAGLQIPTPKARHAVAPRKSPARSVSIGITPLLQEIPPPIARARRDCESSPTGKTAAPAGTAPTPPDSTAPLRLEHCAISKALLPEPREEAWLSAAISSQSPVEGRRNASQAHAQIIEDQPGQQYSPHGKYRPPRAAGPRPCLRSLQSGNAAGAHHAAFMFRNAFTAIITLAGRTPRRGLTAYVVETPLIEQAHAMSPLGFRRRSK